VEDDGVVRRFGNGSGGDGFGGGGDDSGGGGVGGGCCAIIGEVGGGVGGVTGALIKLEWRDVFLFSYRTMQAYRAQSSV
jgi:hypothetical protein